MKKRMCCFLILAFATLGANNFMGQTKTIVAFGDSITAPRKNVTTYSDLIREEFQKEHLDVNVINAGVPGDTTARAKERFAKDVLAHDPDLVIIQLGTNDAAVDVWKKPPATESRVPIKDYEQNLHEFISKLKALKAKIILVTPPADPLDRKIKGNVRQTTL